MRQNHIGDLNVTTLKTADQGISSDVNLLPGMTQKWGLPFDINMEPGPAGRSAGSSLGQDSSTLTSGLIRRSA